MKTPSTDVDVSIVIPTFNESENIGRLISEINEVLKASRIRGEIIVVDDHSPDGTWRIVQRMMEKCDNVQLIIRKGERGLSSAVLRGFEKARGEILCVMDADLSHPPEVIPELVKPIRLGHADMVIASRYVRGSRVEGWSLKRRLISKGATYLARCITDVKDPMSGFFALKRRVIEGVDLSPKGYKIGLEIIAKGRYNRIIEVPFTFRGRKYGKSKLTHRVMMEYLLHLLSLLFAKNSRLRRIFKKPSSRFNRKPLISRVEPRRSDIRLSAGSGLHRSQR